jgi:hypothetical protein
VFFSSINFSASPADPCLFVSNVPGWKCWVHVYVDDLVIVSKDVGQFKKLVLARYLMEDLGPLRHLLGMKIEVVDSLLCVSQGVYTEKVLASYGMDQARTVLTPFVPNTQLLPATQRKCQP